MSFGTWVNGAASVVDKAGNAVSGVTTSLKDKAASLKDKASDAVSGEKYEIVYSDAGGDVQTDLINAGLMTKDIENVLQSVETGNPYRN